MILLINKSIFYHYTAGGAKLLKHVKPATGDQGYIHYIGNIIYEGNQLSYIITEEGRLVNVGTTAAPNFVPEYNLKDHLGNNRVTFLTKNLGGGALEVVQTTDYYPFGLTMNQYQNEDAATYPKNKYLYNGKEIQDDNLNGKFFGMLDYGARFYDPQIGRWHSVDPLAELDRRWSPYRYAYDNPLRFIDPDGMLEDDFYFDDDGTLIHYEENDKPDRVFVRDKEKEEKDPEAPYMEFTQVEMSSKEVESKMNDNCYKKVTEEETVEYKTVKTYNTDGDGRHVENSSNTTDTKLLDQETMYVPESSKTQKVQVEHMQTKDFNFNGSMSIENGVEKRTYTYGSKTDKSKTANKFVLFVFELIGSVL